MFHSYLNDRFRFWPDARQIHPRFKDAIEAVERELPLLPYFQRPEVVVNGNVYHSNRNVLFLSDTSEGYWYSGRLMPSQPLTNATRTLLNLVSEYIGGNFNGALLNEYPDGFSYIAPHSDRTTDLAYKGVAGICFGETRKFRIKGKSSLTIGQKLDVLTPNYSMYWMDSLFQNDYTHERPKEITIKGACRTITFRSHLK